MAQDVCPVCGSEEVEPGDISDGDDGIEFEECACNTCDLEFAQVYKVTRTYIRSDYVEVEHLIPAIKEN